MRRQRQAQGFRRVRKADQGADLRCVMLIESTIGIAALAIVFLIVFYRDPSRHSPPGNTVASPADGKIIGIIPYGKELGVIKVIQVAGLIARRIICFSTKGEMLKKGQRLGKIVLGSQVLLVLPHGVEITAKKGDFVKAGESVVARY